MKKAEFQSGLLAQPTTSLKESLTECHEPGLSAEETALKAELTQCDADLAKLVDEYAGSQEDQRAAWAIYKVYLALNERAMTHLASQSISSAETKARTLSHTLQSVRAALGELSRKAGVLYLTGVPYVDVFAVMSWPDSTRRHLSTFSFSGAQRTPLETLVQDLLGTDNPYVEEGLSGALAPLVPAVSAMRAVAQNAVGQEAWPQSVLAINRIVNLIERVGEEKASTKQTVPDCTLRGAEMRRMPGRKCNVDGHGKSAATNWVV